MKSNRLAVLGFLIVLAGTWGMGCISLPQNETGSSGNGGTASTRTQTATQSGGASSTGGSTSIGGNTASSATTTQEGANAGATGTTGCETGTEVGI